MRARTKRLDHPLNRESTVEHLMLGQLDGSEAIALVSDGLKLPLEGFEKLLYNPTAERRAVL